MSGSNSTILEAVYANSTCYTGHVDTAGVKLTTACYEVANANSVYFQWKIAPIFILGCALFAVFWGLVNALLVSITKSLFVNLTNSFVQIGEENLN